MDDKLLGIYIRDVVYQPLATLLTNIPDTSWRTPLVILLPTLCTTLLVPVIFVRVWTY